MSASMAEVLSQHVAHPESLSHCSCGHYAEWSPTSHAAHQAEMLAANGYGKLEDATRLIRDLIDSDDCQFDHHGGCQAHGYLSLEPGEMCPQLEAKAWIHNHNAAHAVTERGGE